MKQKTLLLFALATFLLTPLAVFADDDIADILGDGTAAETSGTDGGRTTSATSGGNNEIIETIVVNSGEKKEEKQETSLGGVKMGASFSMSYIFGGGPYISPGFFIEIPFASIWAVNFQLAPKAFAITSYSNASTNISGEGEKSYLDIRSGAKIYMFDFLSIGFGFSYDLFMNGYVIDGTSGTYALKVDRSGQSFLHLYGTAGFIAELNDNVFILPEAKVLIALYPTSYLFQRYTVDLSFAMGFRL